MVRGAAITLLAGLAAGCAGDTVIPPTGDAPFVYIILGQRTPHELGGVFGQHAWLLRSGSPAVPATFLEADRFEMRRGSDGAIFGWESYGFTGETVDPWAVSFNEANYHLPDAAAPMGLGADSLEAGERYTLEIAVGGAVITGEVVMPGTFSLSVTTSGGQQVAEWPAVEGAAGYMVVAPGEDASLVTETRYGLTLSETGAEITVHALDPNLWAYLTNDDLGASGVEGGLGVFGALTTATATTRSWSSARGLTP